MTGLHHHSAGRSGGRGRPWSSRCWSPGFLLGGTVGIGTVVFALAIGPIVQWSLGIFDPSGVVARRRAAALGPAPVPVLDALEGPAE